MSLFYVIDGYNLMHKVLELEGLSLQQARENLLELIKVNNLCGKNKVTVVFDGRLDVVAPPHQTNFIVLFSEGESADSLIIRLVSKMDNPKSIKVVTDDKAIITRVRNLNAKHVSTAGFLKKMKTKRSKANYKKNHLDEEELDSITEEFKKKWTGNK
ncbi:MAG: NYN domain-containing protein [Candidatus Kappaea frigidicola]|nr:NYN domain-containing protein [Candidatus Kappaea frigidicola]